MRLLLALVALGGASAAFAQDGYPPLDLRAYVKQAADAKAGADAAMAAATAASAKIPVPSDTAPPSEMIGGTAGSAPTYRRADAAAPRITRAAVVTTDAAGSWAVTWKTPLAATPVVLPIPVAASSQPIICMPSTVTITDASDLAGVAHTRGGAD